MAEFISGSDARGYHLRLLLDQVSQNKGGNTSNLRVRMYLVSTVYSFASYSLSSSFEIDNQTLSGTTVTSMGFNSSVTLIDKTITIKHDSNGSATRPFTAKFNGQGGYSPSVITISKSFKFTDIARKSTASITDNIDLGQAISIEITRNDTSFKHKVTYNWYGITGTIAENVDTSTSFTTPLSWSTNIPNNTNGQGTIYVETFSGTTSLGTNSYVFTGNVPTNIVPNLTGFTLVDTNPVSNNVVKGGENFVQIYSDISVNFGQSTGNYGSTIVGYYAEIVGKNQTVSNNGGTFGMMNYNGTITINARVTDSRGRLSNTITRTVNVIEYYPPQIKFTVQRSGTSMTTLTVTRTVQVAPLIVGGVQKNLMKLDFSVSPFGKNTYTINNGSAGINSYSINSLPLSPANLGGTYTASTSYTVLGVLQDSFSNAKYSVDVPTEAVVYAYDKVGFSIGKIRENGMLDVAGLIYSNNKPIQHLQLSQDNGSAIMFSGDLNNLKTTGFYQANNTNTTNLPTAVTGSNHWYHIIVQRHNDLYIKQSATDFAGTIDSYRICNNGIWGNWIKLINENSPQVKSTWVSIGNGFNYKQVGDVVYLRYDFDTNGVKKLVAGTIPVSLTPRSMMFSITGWTVAVDRQIHIQVNDYGSIEWLNPNAYKSNYRGQISWSI